jgi:hypothetical protein
MPRTGKGGRYVMESSYYKIEFRSVSEHGFKIHGLGFSGQLILRSDLVAVHVN